jgi:hypothetical protein
MQINHAFIKFDGFTFNNAYTTPQTGHYMAINAADAIVSNNTWRDDTENRPWMVRSTAGVQDRLLFTHNTLSHHKGTGVDVHGEDIIYSYNYIYSNRGDAFRCNGNVRAKWLYNENYDAKEVGEHTDFIQGWIVPMMDNLIEGNYIHDGQTNPFLIYGNSGNPYYLPADKAESTRLTFRNNLLVNLTMAAQVEFPYFKAHNNVFIRVAYPSNAVSAIHGPSRANNLTGYEFKNNIVIGCGNGGGLVNGTRGYDVPGASIDADYNYYAKHPNDGWAAENNKDVEVHGINGGNPLFVDFTGNNFRLQVNSPAKDQGYSIPSGTWSSPADKDGVSRPQGSGWAIGAYESVVGGNDARPKNLRIIQ